METLISSDGFRHDGGKRRGFGMDKKRLATKMVEYFSRNLGLDALEVVFVEAMHFKNKHISATFNPDIYRISFNKDWLEDAPAIEIIKVAAHETRHAYQKACVDFPMYFRPIPLLNPRGLKLKYVLGEYQEDDTTYVRYLDERMVKKARLRELLDMGEIIE